MQPLTTDTNTSTTAAYNVNDSLRASTLQQHNTTQHNMLSLVHMFHRSLIIVCFSYSCSIQFIDGLFTTVRSIQQVRQLARLTPTAAQYFHFIFKSKTKDVYSLKCEFSS